VLGHDLRNPLASIAAGARMITKAKSEEETFKIAGLMQTSINRMSLLIDNVLDFCTGAAGRRMQRKDETIVLILDQVVAELRSSHPDTTINAMFNLTQTVNCDGQRIGQLFSNLLGQIRI
jgi:sigma-B regulation protein RsbU (phosphoserine phosphatase)